MADERKIIHGVRLDDGTVVTEVDKLAAAKLPAKTLSRLEKDGSIVGFSKGSAKDEESDDLSSLRVDELKAMAEERSIEGFASMKKADLIAALSEEE